MENARGGSSALAAVARVRERTVGVSRPHAWMLLGGAVLTSVYMAILLALVAGGSSPQVSSVSWGLMIPTVLTYSAVAVGSRDRFGSRLRVPATYRVSLIGVVIGFLVVAGVGLFGGGYPWWVAVLAGGGAFLLLGAPIFGYLWRGGNTLVGGDPWRSHPLTPDARILTIGIGGYLGVTTALSTFAAAVTIVSVVGVLALTASSLAPRARWSVARAGLEWGRAQWIGFAAAVGIMFVLAIATILTGKSLPSSVTILSGVLVLVAMVAAAYTPRPR